MLGPYGVEKAVYLDDDLIVQGDLRELWEEWVPRPPPPPAPPPPGAPVAGTVHAVNGEVVVAAGDAEAAGGDEAAWEPPQFALAVARERGDRCEERVRDLFHFGNPVVDNLLPDPDACALDPDVAVINVAEIRARQLDKKTLDLAQKHARLGLWTDRAHLPILALLLAQPGDVARFDAGWNLADLGQESGFKGSVLMGAKGLHWKSGRRPWAKAGLYKGKWLKYWLPRATAPKPPPPRE